MTFLFNVRTVVWRRLYVQTLLRNSVFLAAELIFVMLCFGVVLKYDQVDPSSVRTLSKRQELREKSSYPFFTQLNERHKWIVVYGPDTNYTKQLVDEFVRRVYNPQRSQLRKPYRRSAQGGDRQPAIRNQASSSSNGSDHLLGRVVQPWKSAEDIPKACLQTLAYQYENRERPGPPLHVVCAQFWDTGPGGIGVDGSLSYSLVYYVPPELLLEQASPIDVGAYLASYSGPYGGIVINDSRRRFVDLILDAQTKIDHAHIALQSRDTACKDMNKGPDCGQSLCSLKYQEMPLKPPFMDVPSYRNGFFFALTIAFCLPLVWRISDITGEITSGLKEYQRLMGLTLAQFWVAHFLSALIMALVEGFCVLLVIYVTVSDFPPPKDLPTKSPRYLWLALKTGQDGPPGDEERAHYKAVRLDFLDVPYLQNADITLLAAVLLAFHISHTMLVLLVSCLVASGRWAMLFGFAFYFVLPMYDGDRFSYLSGAHLSEYLLENRLSKLRKSVYPNFATATVMKIISIFADFDLNANWTVVGSRALRCDSVTILDMWVVMGSTAVGAALLIWYLSNVLPWTAATPEHLLFPLLPSYWRPSRVHPNLESSQKEPRVDERFEAPPETQAVVQCNGLVKYFGSVIALNGVDLTIHSKQVTVLLGQNGAGKTTLMSILTGFLSPSGGSATVAGWHVNTDAARQAVGFCPQKDVFFNDLTVEEHLLYFARIREAADTVKRTNSLLKSMSLTSKAPSLPDQLSGGQRRKLSVCLALLTSPQLLIMDEPTSGMDPTAKKHLWKRIQRFKGRKTVLISTHDMEEADVLGDRIIVMHEGRVICSGSTSFLKAACGVGYKLKVGKAGKGFQKDNVLTVVRQAAPQAVVEEERNNDVIIALRTFDCEGFASMFRQLELGAQRLGISGVGVTAATMADAYIKIIKQWASEEKKLENKDQIPAAGTSAKPAAVAAGEEGANVMAAKVVPANVVPANAVAADVKPLPKLSPNGREQSPAMIPQQDKPTQETTNKKFRRGSWSRDECQQFLALISKRGSYLGRSPFLLLTAWILPVAIAYLATTTLTARQVDTGMLPRKIAVSAPAQFGTGARAFLHEMTTDNCSINYRVLLESQAAAIDKVQNPQVKLLDSLERDYVLYASTYPMGAELYQRTITGWYNPAAIMSLLVQNNLMQTANLRAATNKRDLRIYTNLTLDLMPDDLLRIISDRDDDEMLQQLKLAVEQNWAYWGCMVTVSMGLLLSPFVALPAAENHSGVRGLQLMSGVSGCVYVTAHFTFDFLFYFVPMSTIYGGFIYLQQLSLETGVALFTILLVFAPIGILLPYIVAEHITSETTANSVIMGIYALGGPAAFLLFLTSVTAFRSQALSIPLLIFPPFLLGAATIRAVNLEYEAAMCNDLRSRSSVDKTLVNFCDEMRLLGSGIIHCCKMLTSDLKKEAWQVTGPFSFSWYSIQAPLTLMVALSACLFTYAVHKASGDIFGEEKLQDLHTPALDEDVENEKQLVNTIVREKKFAEYTLVARNLHKFFGEFYAVRGIYLALRPGECFGLVGVNGAGKTTTFQMLAALIPMTDGNAYMKTFVLNKAPRQWQAHIGYCPQRDSLLGKLNAYETLFLFGRLRGVPERVLAVMVQELIIKVDLEEYAAKPCECYSGGNKRKLSIATAMVGFPPVVFLDEPFAGVDVASRIHIQRVLADVKVATKTTFILTTHNMEECEEACDRIGIMVKGQMTCLGPMWHLRVKFGGSLTLKFKLAEGAKVDDEQLDTAVLQEFPGAKRLEGKDRVQKVAEYRLQYRIPWSVLFQRVAALRKTFTFDHIVVSDSSLEQLLVAFARKARKEAELEPED